MFLFGNIKRCFILTCIIWEVIQNIIENEWFRRVWEFCGYLIIKIFYQKLLGSLSKLCILNTFNLWAFHVGLPLCYDIGDYPVFMMTSVWRVITPSLWSQARLKPLTLHDAGKSLSVWVRLLPIRPKDHMQKGYCVMRHSLLPMGGRVKSFSVWVR